MVYHGVIVVWSLLAFPCLPLLSCLSCDSFCWLPFRLRFFLLIPLFFPILFFLLVHLHFVKFLLSACKYSFHPVVSFSRLVLRSGTKPKRRQNSRQAAWHEPGQRRQKRRQKPLLLLLAPLSLLRVAVLILAHPGTVFYNFCHCCCH